MNGSRAWFEKDFYSTLGVAQDASAEEIKRAFKKLARKHHPDRNPNDKAAEERMKDASEAYDVLSDPQKRQEYDQMRRLARSGYAGGAPGAGWQTNIRFQDIPFDLGDLFGGAFRGARRGSDLEARVRISFEDAINGVTVPVRVGRDEVKVKIPAGIKDGARIRARGRGGRGEGAHGDLHVVVEVAPHPLFGRNGDDLTTSVSISYPEAVLGTAVSVPTMEQPVTLRVPAGTQPGTTLRARGKGPRTARGTRGDLLVSIQVDVPRAPTEEERELIGRLAGLQRDVNEARA